MQHVLRRVPVERLLSDFQRFDRYAQGLHDRGSRRGGIVVSVACSNADNGVRSSFVRRNTLPFLQHESRQPSTVNAPSVESGREREKLQSPDRIVPEDYMSGSFVVGGPRFSAVAMTRRTPVVEAAQMGQDPWILAHQRNGWIDAGVRDEQLMLGKFRVKWHVRHRPPVFVRERKHQAPMLGSEPRAPSGQSVPVHLDQTPLMIALDRNGRKLSDLGEHTS